MNVIISIDPNTLELQVWAMHESETDAKRDFERAANKVVCDLGGMEQIILNDDDQRWKHLPNGPFAVYSMDDTRNTIEVYLKSSVKGYVYGKTHKRKCVRIFRKFHFDGHVWRSAVAAAATTIRATPSPHDMIVDELKHVFENRKTSLLHSMCQPEDDDDNDESVDDAASATSQAQQANETSEPVANDNFHVNHIDDDVDAELNRLIDDLLDMKTPQRRHSTDSIIQQCQSDIDEAVARFTRDCQDVIMDYDDLPEVVDSSDSTESVSSIDDDDDSEEESAVYHAASPPHFDANFDFSTPDPIQQWAAAYHQTIQRWAEHNSVADISTSSSSSLSLSSSSEEEYVCPRPQPCRRRPVDARRIHARAVQAARIKARRRRARY